MLSGALIFTRPPSPVSHPKNCGLTNTRTVTSKVPSLWHMNVGSSLKRSMIAPAALLLQFRVTRFSLPPNIPKLLLSYLLISGICFFEISLFGSLETFTLVAHLVFFLVECHKIIVFVIEEQGKGAYRIYLVFALFDKLFFLVVPEIREGYFFIITYSTVDSVYGVKYLFIRRAGRGRMYLPVKLCGTVMILGIRIRSPKVISLNSEV